MTFVNPSPTKPSAKRHLWLVSLTYPTLPLLGLGIAIATGQLAWVWLTTFIVYVAMPITDHFVGDDKNDILGLMEDEATQSLFYRYMVHGLLPLIYLTWLVGAWAAVTYSWPVWAYVGLAIGHGWGLTFAINSGHETGHKPDKISKWVALLMLAPSFLGHFRVEHNTGHHSDVSTPRDHATARFGESYWAFLTREIPGAWTRSWRIESKRASRKGYSKWSLKNEVIQTVLMQTVIWGAVIAWLGPNVIPYLLIAMAVSVTALSSQNYLAHYGLLRDKRPDGKYLPAKPQHSWNTNSLMTNLTSYNLARHSDHHANPSRHYQYLRSFTDVPTLPHGYGVMYLLAYVPPLWRKVMDPLVLANVDGDMSKVLTKELALAEGQKR
jgi:alkane 1-monooxygenase